MRRPDLFWLACVPLRSLLALYASTPGNHYLLRLILGVVGARWLLRLENGVEGFFGGDAWWKEERGVHGAMYVLYAKSGIWQFLMVDVVFGVLNWTAEAVEQLLSGRRLSD
jgi:hypothetical protein